MTRDPHCDGCKADDKLRALRRERDELQAKLDALGEPEVERRVWRFLRVEGRPVELMERTVYRSPWRPVSPETTP